MPLLDGSSSRRRFAVLIPIGPKMIDLWRAKALMMSLVTWEPDVAWCVLIDDALVERRLYELRLFTPGCCGVIISDTKCGVSSPMWGGVTSAMLRALQWLHLNTDADLVLKIDTDALVIAPFATDIRSFLSDASDSGLVGTLGLSCNPTFRAQRDLRVEPDILRAARTWPTDRSLEEAEDGAEVGAFGWLSRQQLRCFDAIRSHIASAVKFGYASNEYCQGGAYAITRLMVDRMARKGYLAAAHEWGQLPFEDDVLMAMYARAVNLHIRDCSKKGEPFGVQCQQLPYPPERLASDGYSIIHSVKNDRRFSEAEIRKFFSERIPPGTLAQLSTTQWTKASVHLRQKSM